MQFFKKQIQVQDKCCESAEKRPAGKDGLDDNWVDLFKYANVIDTKNSLRRSAVKQSSTSAESQQNTSSENENQLSDDSNKKIHVYVGGKHKYDILGILPKHRRQPSSKPAAIKTNMRDCDFVGGEQDHGADYMPFLDEENGIDLKDLQQRQQMVVKGRPSNEEEDLSDDRNQIVEEPIVDDQIGQIQEEEFIAEWCGFCQSVISEQEQLAGNYTMLQSTDCFHNAHVNCLKKAISEKRSADGYLNCPTCDRNINDFELKMYVSEAEWRDVENYEVRQMLLQDDSLKQCRCGNVIEFVKGEVDYGQKDDKGQLLSREAAQHMAEYRIRCNECEQNFCHKCMAYPYHIGKTCDQLNNVQCRYCLEEIKEWNDVGGAAFTNVCKSEDCQKMIRKSCDKILECGHPCGGIRGEKKCLPCLEPQCIAKMDISQAPNVDKDEFCSICYTSGLGQEPCIQLDCNHIVHHDCLIEQVSKGWNGARIVFNYLDCSQCKREISCSNSEQLSQVLMPQLKFKQIVLDKAQKRAEYDGLDKDEKFLKPGNPFGGDLIAFAMSTLSYYQCFQCKDAYFVGRKDCAEGAQLDVNNLNKETLKCSKCSPKVGGGGKTDCEKHGTDFIEFKCKFCCRRAVWFCWGTTHFCDPCHRKAYTVKDVARDQLPKCKGKDCEIQQPHPAAGEEFALGCGLCRDMPSDQKDDLDF